MAIPYKEALDTLEKMFQTLDRDIIASVLLNNSSLYSFVKSLIFYDKKTGKSRIQSNNYSN